LRARRSGRLGGPGRLARSRSARGAAARVIEGVDQLVGLPGDLADAIDQGVGQLGDLVDALGGDLVGSAARLLEVAVGALLGIGPDVGGGLLRFLKYRLDARGEDRLDVLSLVGAGVVFAISWDHGLADPPHRGSGYRRLLLPGQREFHADSRLGCASSPARAATMKRTSGRFIGSGTKIVLRVSRMISRSK
jgi:hypothetical protein